MRTAQDEELVRPRRARHSAIHKHHSVEQSAIATPLNTRLKTDERNLVSAISGLALDGPSERMLVEKVGVELDQISHQKGVV